MKKKKVLQFLILGIFILNLVSSAQCNLETTMISQDPYPAIPGEYVKLVFEISGIQSDCGKVNFELLEDYPIHYDPNDSPIKSFSSGIYEKDYRSVFMANYKVRVDEDALDGDNLIRTRYKLENTDTYITKDFNLSVEEVRADFEVFVKDYDYSTHVITLEILNIAENDVEALTVEIPKQESIDVKGANRNIVGDLDANEYTTADFEAIPSDAEINLIIYYTDETNIRRNVEKTIKFDSSYFKDRKTEEKSSPIITYIIILLIIAGIIYWHYKLRKKKKKNLHKH